MRVSGAESPSVSTMVEAGDGTSELVPRPVKMEQGLFKGEWKCLVCTD